MNNLTITERLLYDRWAKEDHIIIGGTKYKVGKMSYGDYFLEPGKSLGERSGFNSGTLWLKLVDNKKRLYGVEGIA